MVRLTGIVEEDDSLRRRLKNVSAAIDAQIENDVSQLSAAGRSLIKLPLATLLALEERLKVQLKIIDTGGRFPYAQRVGIKFIPKNPY